MANAKKAGKVARADIVGVRFTTEERAAIERAAARYGVPLSMHIRILALRDAGLLKR